MFTFYEWLSNLDLINRLRLIETYYTFDHEKLNQVYRDELQKVIERTSDSAQRRSLERLLDFDWIVYIAGAMRRIYRDYREGQEAISDMATKLLLGKLFRGFTVPPSNEDAGDYLLARFKSSLNHALQNHRKKRPIAVVTFPRLPFAKSTNRGAVTVDDLPGRSTAR